MTPKIDQYLITPTPICFELRIASLSDIHLGHPRNEATYILQNLYAAFPDNVETGKLDIILIAGDLFDRALMLSDEAIREIDLFFVYLLRLCKRYDIMLIILEGTPSHDRKQPKRIHDLNKLTDIQADVLYVDELSIKHIERFGIDVLFVPDECRPTTDKIYEDVLEMMSNAGLSTVDYAFMHGTFDYMVPAIAKCPKHSSQAYLQLVDKLIFIGHNHPKSVFDRIKNNGSFDRLTHGDEIPKGHYRACIRSGKDYDLTFVENVNARTFNTIDVQNLDMDKTIEVLTEAVDAVKDQSFLRVKAQKGHPVLGSMLTIERKWPYINWSKLEVCDKERDVSLPEKIDVTIYNAVTITPTNIAELFLTRALNRDGVDDRIVAIAEKKLKELK